MSKKLYVGNIEWGLSEEDLEKIFAEFGEVEEAIIIRDKMSGRSRGFGFVTMVNDADADSAMAALNGQEQNGRELTVNEARSRE